MRASNASRATRPNAIRRRTRLDMIVTGQKSKAAQLETEKRHIQTLVRHREAAGTYQSISTRHSEEERQVTARRRRGDPRYLNIVRILRLPLDVIIEIMSRLGVLDLLSLSRTSKRIRNMILSKVFRSAWRNALRDLGAPECPPGISEPQFVRLAFDSTCQGCGAPRVWNTDLGLYVRLCPGCSSMNVLRGKKLLEVVPDAYKNDITIFHICYFKGAYKLSDLERQQMSAFELAKQEFFYPDFWTTLRKYCSFAPESEEQKAYVSARKNAVKRICEHTQSVESWLHHLGVIRAPESALRKYLRRISIEERLKNLGYNVDLRILSQLDSNVDKIVYQPKELTELEWREIRPKLQYTLTRLGQRH